MPAPVLTAHARPARRFASPFARALSWAGFAIIAALALVSAGWTLLLVACVLLSAAVTLRTRRRRWELDAPGPDARMRFGPRASRSVRLADLDGVMVVRIPGATTRGIPVTRDHEHWWFVSPAGAALGRASTDGLDPADVERFRAAIGAPFVPMSLAERAGAVPVGLPWHVRHPQAALVVATLASIVVMVGVLSVPPYWG